MNNKTDNIKYGKDELENLWTAVCYNDIEFMKNYYANGGIPNKRYKKFNNDNSLIMGALRNKNYDMVDLLIKNGETLVVGEIDEYKKLMIVHNYNDKLTNIDKVTDILDNAHKFRENTIYTPPIESRLTLEEQEVHKKELEKIIKVILNG